MAIDPKDVKITIGNQPVEGYIEEPLPPSLAPEAGPYLRKIFGIINDPSVEGRARSAEFYVPEHLHEFCAQYLDSKGYRSRFFRGPLTGKPYVTIAPKDEK